MQKDIVVPAEAVVDGQLDHRLAPLVAGQELASAVIQDTVKYLGIQATGISQLNGPYLQVRPAGLNASDILLVGSWRTHYGPGGNGSGSVLDSLQSALPKPTPSTQLMMVSAASTYDERQNDQVVKASPHAPARPTTKTGFSTTPVTAAMAADQYPNAQQLDDTFGPTACTSPESERIDVVQYSHPHYKNGQQQHLMPDGSRGVSQPPADGISSSSNEPIVECPSDTEPSPTQQRHTIYRHHHDHDQELPFPHATHVGGHMGQPAGEKGGFGGAAQLVGSPVEMSTPQLVEAPSDPDRAMEDVSAPQQPLAGQQPSRLTERAPAVHGGARATGAASERHLVQLQGPAILAAGAFASAAAAEAAGIGAVPPTADEPSVGTVSGPLMVVSRPRSEWELDPSKIVIGRRLAVGGFGEVFVAKYEGTLVALKRLLATDTDTTQRFLDEVHMLARLRHPNLLLFMGYTLTPEPSIITELMARGSLFHILRQAGNRPLEVRMQRSVAVAVARGMAYLHSRSPPILHLDLKSPNVLVDGRWRVKIADFGLSRVRQRTYVSSGAAAGSPEWMAPEVLRCDHYAEAADVYSYGVILWELLTGKAPWADLNAMQVVGAVGFARRSLPDPIEGDALLLQLFKACRTYEPSLRPTFAQIVEALERNPAAAATCQARNLGTGPAGEAAAAATGASGRDEAGPWRQQQLPALPPPEAAAPVTEPPTLAAGIGTAASWEATRGGGSGGAGTNGADACVVSASAAARITRRHSLASSSDNDGLPAAAVGASGGSFSSGGLPPRIDARFMSVHESPRSRRRYRSPRGEDMVGPPAVTARLQDGRKTPSPRTSGGMPWRADMAEPALRPAQTHAQAQPQAQPPLREPAAGAVGVRLVARSTSPFAAAAAADFGPESVDDLRALRMDSVKAVAHGVSSPTVAADAAVSAEPQPMELGSPGRGAPVPSLRQQHEQQQSLELQQQPSAAALDVHLPLPPTHAMNAALSVGGELAKAPASLPPPLPEPAPAMDSPVGPHPSPRTHISEGRPQGQLQHCAMHKQQTQQESYELSHAGQFQYEHKLPHERSGAQQALPLLHRQTEEQPARTQVQPAQQHCLDMQTAHKEVQQQQLAIDKQEQHQNQQGRQEQQEQEQAMENPAAAGQITPDRLKNARPGHRRVSSDEAGRLMRVAAGALGSATAGQSGATGKVPGDTAVAQTAAPAPSTYGYMLPSQLQHRAQTAVSGGGGAGGGGGSLPPRRSRGLARNSAPMRYTYGGTPSGAGSQPHHQLQSPPRPRVPHSLGHVTYPMHQQVLTANAEAAAAAASAHNGQQHPSHGLASSPLQPHRPGGAPLGTPLAPAVGGAEAGPAALGAPVSLSPMGAADATAAAAVAVDASGRLASVDYHDPASLASGNVMPAAGGGAPSTDAWPDTHSELSFAFILRDNVSVCSDDYMQSASLDRLPLLEEDDMTDSLEDPPADGAPASATPTTTNSNTDAPMPGCGTLAHPHVDPGHLNAGTRLDQEFELPKPFLQPDLSPKGGVAATPSRAASSGLAVDPPQLWVPSFPDPKGESGGLGGAGAEVQVDACPEADLWAALQQHSPSAQHRRGSGGLLDAPTAQAAVADLHSGAPSVTEDGHGPSVAMVSAHVEAPQCSHPRAQEASQAVQQQVQPQGNTDSAAAASRSLSRVASSGSAGATTYRSGRFKVTIEMASQDPGQGQAQVTAPPRQPASPEYPLGAAPRESPPVVQLLSSPQLQAEAAPPGGPTLFAEHDEAVSHAAAALATQGCPDCSPAPSPLQGYGQGATAAAAAANCPPSPSGAAALASPGTGPSTAAATAEAVRTPGGHARSSHHGHGHISGHQGHGHGHGHHGHSELSGGLALNSVTMYRKGRFFVSAHAAAGTHSLSVTNPLAAPVGATSSHTGTAAGAGAGGSGSVDESDDHDGASGPTSPFAAVTAVPPCSRMPSQTGLVQDGVPPTAGPTLKMSWAAVAALPPSQGVRQESLGRQYSCGRFTVAESIVAAPCPEPRRPSTGSAAAEPGPAAPGAATTAMSVGRGSPATGPALAPALVPQTVEGSAASAARQADACSPPQQPQLHHHQQLQQQGQGTSRFAAPPQLRVLANCMDMSAPTSGPGPGAPAEAGSGGGVTPGTAPASPRPDHVVVRKVGRFTVRQVEGSSNASSRAPSNSGTPTPDGQPTADPARVSMGGCPPDMGAIVGSGGGISGDGAVLQGSPPDEAMVLSSHHSSCSLTSASGCSRASSASHGLDVDMHAPHGLPPQEQLLRPSQQESNEAQAPLQGLLSSQQESSQAQAAAQQGFQPSQQSLAHAQRQHVGGLLSSSQQDSSSPWYLQSLAPQPSQQESQAMPQGMLLSQSQQDSQHLQHLLSVSGAPWAAQPSARAAGIEGAAHAMPVVVTAATAQPLGSAEAHAMKILRVKSRGRFTVIEHEAVPPQARQPQPVDNEQQLQRQLSAGPGTASHRSSSPSSSTERLQNQGLPTAHIASGVEAGASQKKGPNSDSGGRLYDSQQAPGGSGNAACLMSCPLLAPAADEGTEGANGEADEATEVPLASYGGVLYPVLLRPLQQRQHGRVANEDDPGSSGLPLGFGASSPSPEQQQLQPQQQARVAWGLSDLQDEQHRAQFRADTAWMVRERMERNALERQLLEQQQRQQQQQRRQQNLRGRRHAQDGQGRDRAVADGGAAEADGDGDAGADDNGGFGNRCTYELSFGDGLTIQISHEVHPGEGAAVEDEEEDPGADAVMVDVGIVQGEGEAEEGVDESGGASDGDARDENGERADGQRQDGDAAGAEEEDWELQSLRAPETPTHEPMMERERTWFAGSDSLGAGRRKWRRRRRDGFEDDVGSVDEDSMEF